MGRYVHAGPEWVCGLERASWSGDLARKCKPHLTMSSFVNHCTCRMSILATMRACLWALLICQAVSAPTATPSDPPLIPLSLAEMREIADARANWASLSDKQRRVVTSMAQRPLPAGSNSRHDNQTRLLTRAVYKIRSQLVRTSIVGVTGKFDLRAGWVH